MEKEDLSAINKLKIPENTSDRNDYIQGIGRKELAVIAGALGASLVFLVSALVARMNMPACMFTAILVVAATTITVKRDSTNESLVDKVRFMARYRKSQKRYLYVQHDHLQGWEEGNLDSK